MAHNNTVLNQMLQLFYRHAYACAWFTQEFNSLAKEHHTGQKFRSFSRYTQFVALLFAQVTGRNSLHYIINNLKSQAKKLYHSASLIPQCRPLRR